MFPLVIYVVLILSLFISPLFVDKLFPSMVQPDTDSMKIVTLCEFWDRYKWHIIPLEGISLLIFSGYLYIETTMDLEIKVVLISAFLWSQLFLLSFVTKACTQNKQKAIPPHGMVPDNERGTL